MIRFTVWILWALTALDISAAESPFVKVKRVFIDPEIAGTDVELSKMVREKLIYGLMTYGNVAIAATKEQADAILTGAAHREKMNRMAVINGIAAGGDYSVVTLVLRLVDRQENIIWVFNSDAAKCKAADGPSVCAAKEFDKARRKAK